MATYITKPREFEAVQVKAVEFQDLMAGIRKGGLFEEVPEWLDKAWDSGEVIAVDDQTTDYTAVLVKGFMGTDLIAHADDWVATDDRRGLYVITAERFKEITQ